jgi:WD40 repeat protein
MDARRLLQSLSLEQYVASFEENAIDSDTLRALTDHDLKSLGVAALGHRKKILAALAAVIVDGPAARASASGPADATPGARLPTLLALPLAEMAHETAPVLSLWAACDAVEIALKVCVMSGLAEHSTLPPELLRDLRDRVEMPTLGKWLGMAQAVAKRAPKNSVLPLAATVGALEPLLGGKGATVETGLLALRNRLAHGGPMSRTEATRLSLLWQPRVRTWAESSLGWLESASLVAVNSDGARVVLRGVEGHEAVVSLPVPSDAPAGSSWLCIGDRALALGPLGAYDPERRAMQVYVRRGEVRLQYLRLGDEGGLCDSDVPAVDHFRRLFFVPSPDDSVHRFTIADFTQEVRKEASRRVGRDTELRTLVEFARGLGTGTLWVGGPAGIGKSNLLAAATEELVEQPPEGALVLPYRFRAGDARCGRAPFLIYLRERLEASDCLAPEVSDGEDRGSDDCESESYRVSAGLSSKKSGKKGPKQANLMVDPVQEVRDIFARLLPDRRVLLVLDGLDEVAERDTRFAEDVLLRLRADRVGIIAAGRPERGLPELFARIGAADPFPNGLPPMSELDMRALLLERTGTARKGLLGRDKESGGAVRNAFIERVTKQSEGLPIYVNYVVGDLNAGKLSPEHADALPASLHAYHDELLRRAAIGDLQAVTTPVLVLLALALEPLTIEETAALLVRRGVLSSPDAALIERAVQQIGSMVRRAPDPDGEEGFTVFHHSLRTHLLGSPGVCETVAATRRALADAAMKPAGDVAEAYLYRCGARHLLEADRVSEALDLLTAFDLVMARFQRLDATGRAADEWYADWDRVRTRADKLEGAARTWWDFARTSRHLFRKEGWESWRVLFQAAMDHADDSAVTIAAEKYEAEGRRDWAWLRWVNREKVWYENPVVAVMVGHTSFVEGAMPLVDGRILSWSRDNTLRLWDGATGSLLAMLEGHTRPVSGAAVLANGRILSWSGDKTLRLWDGATGSPLAMLDGHTDRVFGAMALADGRIVSWSGDKTLRLWDGAAGRPLATLDGHAGEVESATVLADGRILSWSNDNNLRLWDGATGSPLVILEGHTGKVRGAAVLANGRILSWSGDKTLRLWDGATGSSLATFKKRMNKVQGATVLPDGHILSWSYDNNLRLWDGATGSSLARLEGHTDYVSGAAILPDGRIVSWSGDMSLRLWDGTTGSLLATLEGHASEVEGAIVLPDGCILSWARRDDALRLWEGTTGSLLVTLEGHTNGVNGATALPDGRILSWSADMTLRLWDVAMGNPRVTPEGHADRVAGATVLSDGRILSWSGDMTLRLWDVATGSPLATLDGHRSAVSGATVSLDGHILSWSSVTVCLWAGPTGSLLAVLEGHTSTVNGATVLVDGRVLSWSWDQTLRLWDGATGNLLATLRGHTHAVYGVTVLPDGRILSWSGDKTLRLWDGATGRPLATLEGHENGVNGATVLADGRILSWSDDKTLRLWDSATGSPLATLEGHTLKVTGAVLLPDGRILSWSTDKTLRLWDGSTGSPRARLKGHRAAVAQATLLPDGRILSWSTDKTLRLWDGASGSALRVIATRQGWLDGDADLVAHARPHERAAYHSLHLGFTVADATPEFAIFTGGRHVRLCRFVPAPVDQE